MKKILSAAVAFAAAVGMTVCAFAAEPDDIAKRYNAVKSLIGDVGTFISGKLSIAEDNKLKIDNESVTTIKYYAKENTEQAAEIAYDLGKVEAGNSVTVDMKFKMSDPGTMQQYLFVLPDDEYNKLRSKESKEYYNSFLETYLEYKMAKGTLYDEQYGEQLRNWSDDILTIENLETDGHLISCVVGKATTKKLTSHVAWFDVTVTSSAAESEPEKVTLTPVGDTVQVDNGYGKAFTFEADLTEKQISNIVLTYGDKTAKLISDDASAAIESNAKIGIIVTAETEEEVNAFDSENVTISFKGGSRDEI